MVTAIKLFNTLLRVVGLHEDAADAVQDAFVQAYTADLPAATPILHLAIPHCDERPQSPAPLEADGLGRPGQGSRRARSCFDAEARRMLCFRRPALLQVHRLNNLGDEHRTILVLREIEGARTKKRRTFFPDLPVGTVRSRIFRARATGNETSPQRHLGEEAEKVS